MVLSGPLISLFNEVMRRIERRWTMVGPNVGTAEWGKQSVYRRVREDWKWDSDLGGLGWLAGQAVTSSRVERFRMGERLETV